MGCCNNCNEKEKVFVSREVAIDFNAGKDGINEDFIGKRFELTAVGFMGCSKNFPSETISHVSQTGDTWLISIYRMKLPFNELLATIQFNPRTGNYVTKAFTRLDFNQVVLHLSVVPHDLPLYKRIGPGLYRVRTYAGVHALIEDFISPDSDQGKALLKIAEVSRHPSRWPMLVAVEGGKNPFIRMADTIEIPDWKNDQAWQ